MAALTKRVGRTGQISWQAKVRLNGVNRSKTFVKKSCIDLENSCSGVIVERKHL